MNDIQEWLGYVQGPDGQPLKQLLGDEFLKNDIKTGDVLLELNDAFLKEIGIPSLGLRIKILKGTCFFGSFIKSFLKFHFLSLRNQKIEREESL